MSAAGNLLEQRAQEVRNFLNIPVLLELRLVCRFLFTGSYRNLFFSFELIFSFLLIACNVS